MKIQLYGYSDPHTTYTVGQPLDKGLKLIKTILSNPDVIQMLKSMNVCTDQKTLDSLASVFNYHEKII